MRITDFISGVVSNLFIYLLNKTTVTLRYLKHNQHITLVHNQCEWNWIELLGNVSRKNYLSLNSAGCNFNEERLLNLTKSVQLFSEHGK